MLTSYDWRTRSAVALSFFCTALVSVGSSFAAEEGVRELRLPGVLVESEVEPQRGFELPPTSYPLEPVEQQAFYGARHGPVNTTTGGLAFRMVDMRLPGRMPLEFGRVYDSKISSSMPPPPPGRNQEQRTTEDLGKNWLPAYSSYLINTMNGFEQATVEGDLVWWINQGNGTYLPDGPPSKHLKFVRIDVNTLVETQLDGTRWTYKAGLGYSYALTRIEDRSGNFIAITYTAGYVSKIENSDGAYFTITRGLTVAPHRIWKVTDHTGRQVIFGYNVVGQLSTAKDVMGQTWAFEYDLDRKLIVAKDPLLNAYLTATYDASYRILSYETRDGLWSFTYNTAAKKTTAQDASAHVWEYKYNADGVTTRVTEPTGGVHELVLNATRDPVGYTGPEGLSASWSWDSLHRPSSYTPPGTGSNTISYVYDAQQGWVNSVTSLSGGVRTFTRDSAGRVLQELAPDGAKWTATYATNGDRLTLRLPKGNVPGGSGYQWSFVYDSYGQITSATDPTGRVFQFDYTSYGDLWKVRRPDHRNAQNQLVYSEWIYTRDAAGRITTITDPLNHGWTRSYDTAGRLTGQAGPAGTTVQYGYNSRHRLVWAKLVDGVSDPTTSYSYNAMGRLASKTLPGDSTWSYGYDASSRLISVTDPLNRSWSYARDQAGRIESITHPGGQEVTLERDDAGRLTERTIPGGRVESFVYDPPTGQLLSAAVDVNGEWNGRVEWTYDAMNRPTSITTALDDGTGEKLRTLSFTYDANGNRTQLVSEPEGETATYGYDALDRLLSTTSTLYPGWAVTYDPDSGHRKQVAATGRWKNWSYDPAGRLLTEAWDWLGESTGSFSYGYDAEGRLISTQDLTSGTTGEAQFNALGLPTLYQEHEGSTVTAAATISYNAVGRPVQRIRSVEGEAPQTFVFNWDAAGRLTYARRDDQIRLYLWDDEPDDPEAALRVWRVPADADEASTEMLYGFDGRLERMENHLSGAEEPTVLAEYRWAPLAADRAFEARELRPDQTYDAREMAFDIGGYYAQLADDFTDIALLHPVLGTDLAADALREQSGRQLPDPAAPFALGAWSGMERLEATGRATALAGFATGLIEGRLEKGITLSGERRQFGGLAAFDDFRPGQTDVYDDWLEQTLVGEEPVGDRSDLLNSAPLPSPSYTGPGDGYDWGDYDPICYFNHRLCTYPVYDVICQCDYSTVEIQFNPGGSAGPTCSPCGANGGVAGAPYPQGSDPVLFCSYAFDRPSGLPEYLRGADLSAGNVSLVNGEFVEDVTDLSVFDPGGDINFSRTYRSGILYQGALGYRWFHNWEEMVVLSTTNDPVCDKTARWIDPHGKVIDFELNASGDVVNQPPESMYRLRKVDSSHYELRHVAGELHTFTKYGDDFLLTSLKQATNLLELLRDGQTGRLLLIRSDGVVRLQFLYDGSGRIESVRNGIDSLNDLVHYHYNACGELDTVTRPVTLLNPDAQVTGEPEIQYVYDNISPGDCHANTLGKHVLMQIGVRQVIPALGGGTTSSPVYEKTVQNVYYPIAPGSNDTQLKVSWQCLGNKTCASPANLTLPKDLVYAYQVDSSGPTATITDNRIGGVTEIHKYNENRLVELREAANGLNRVTIYTYHSTLKLPIRTTYADGRCEETIYVQVAGAWLPRITRERAKDQCAQWFAQQPEDPLPSDRVTYRTYEAFGGKVRTITGPEAFPTGEVFEPFDPNAVGIREWTTSYYYDYDDGDPLQAHPPAFTAQCSLWNLPCTPRLGELNGETSDDQNWFGNVVQMKRLVPSDNDERPEGNLVASVVYRADGRVWKQKSPNGVTTVFKYYGDGDGEWDWRFGHFITEGSAEGPVAVQRREPRIVQGEADPPQPLEEMMAWSKQGRRLAEQDVQGVVKEFDLATSGNVLEETVCRLTGGATTCDQAQATILGRTRRTYDLRGRMLAERALASDGSELREVWTTYDDLGRPTTTTIDPHPAAVPGGSEPTNPPSDPLHLRSRMYYDGRSRVTKTLTPEGRATCFTYDNLDRLLETRSRAALDTVGSSPCGSSADDLVTTTVYDAMDRPVINEDAEHHRIYSWYDTQGRLEFVSDGKPTWPAIPYSPTFLGSAPNLPTTSNWYSQTSYDDAWRPVRQRFSGRTHPLGPTHDFLQVSWQQYDTLGRPTAAHVGVATGPYLPTGTFDNGQGSDGFGPPTVPVEGLSLATKRSFYNLRSERFKTIDPTGKVTNYEYDTFGRPKKTLAATVGGHRDTVEVSYDSVGRREFAHTTVYDPEGRPEIRTAKTVYDAWGRVFQTIGAPDTENLITEYGYDALGRVTQQVRRWQAASANDRVQEQTYDAAGRVFQRRARESTGVWATTTYGHDLDSLVASLKDAENNLTEWQHDPFGRVQRMLYPVEGGKRQTVEYAEYYRTGLPRVVQYREDNNGSARRLVHTHTYDERGRLQLRAASFEGSGAPAFFGTTEQTFFYDDLGRVVLARDHSNDAELAGGQDIEVTFRYDTAGRKLEENQRLPLTAVGLVDHKIESNYALDGFRTELWYPWSVNDSGQPLDRYHLSYVQDAAGRPGEVWAPQTPTDVVLPAVRTPRLLANFQYLGTQVWSQSYGNGAELRMHRDGSLGAKAPLYDGLGRPTGMRTVGQNPSASLPDYRFGYDPVGNLTFEQALHEPLTTGPAPTFHTRAYTTDLLGRLTAWSEGGLVSADATAFPVNTTNPVGFLASPSAAESWSLDFVGNWFSKTEGVGGAQTTANFESNALNQYASVTPQNGSAQGFSHDWLGQLREDASKSRKYIWDAFGRLTKVCASGSGDCPSLQARYRYDALNRRVEKYVTSGIIGTGDLTNRYIYDGWRAIEERGLRQHQTGPEAGTWWEPVRARYGYGIGLDQVLWMDRDVARDSNGAASPFEGSTNDVIESRYFIHQDVRGSTVAMDDDPAIPPNGQVVERFSYTGYGKGSAWWGTEWQEVVGIHQYSEANYVSKFGLPYLYTGQRFDPESGLHYYRNRYYDAQQGRFVSRDPLGVTEGPNLYQYASLNPTVSRDPLGLRTEKGDWAGPGVSPKRAAFERAEAEMSSRIPGRTYHVGDYVNPDRGGGGARNWGAGAELNMPVGCPWIPWPFEPTEPKDDGYDPRPPEEGKKREISDETLRELLWLTLHGLPLARLSLIDSGQNLIPNPSPKMGVAMNERDKATLGANNNIPTGPLHAVNIVATVFGNATEYQFTQEAASMLVFENTAEPKVNELDDPKGSNVITHGNKIAMWDAPGFEQGAWYGKTFEYSSAFHTSVVYRGQPIATFYWGNQIKGGSNGVYQNDIGIITPEQYKATVEYVKQFMP